MPARKPTRLYLRMSKDTYARFLWFHNHKPSEMLMGLYGLTGEPGVLQYVFPEYLVSTSEPGGVRYEYADARKVGRPIDHITCHADGRFHIKTKQGEDLYIHRMQGLEPLGPDTPRFLEFAVASDLLGRYAAIQGVPKRPYAWIQARPGECVTLTAAFSGVNFPLESEVAEIVSQSSQGRHSVEALIRLRSGTLKGVISAKPLSLTPEALAARPSGTIISFHFPTAEGQWHIKTLIFS